MADKSTIEWTDATWNPVRGCSIVSKGCTNCYAMRQAHRFNQAGGAYQGLTKLTKGGPVWNDEVRTVPALLGEPGSWKKPRRIFVNSMSDLFHEKVPDDFIGDVFFRMALSPQHIFQVLTKRPKRMLEWLFTRGLDSVRSGEREEVEEQEKKWPWPLRNVWLGVSVEDQATADERIPLLLQAPAAVRWISAEPLLERIDLRDPPNDIGEPRLSYLERVDLADPISPRIDWVVAGGESGPGARPMHPAWARGLRDQCAAAGVPFFFKQWGAWAPIAADPAEAPAGLTDTAIGAEGYDRVEQFKVRCEAVEWSPGGLRSLRIGKGRAGRELDGRTYDEYPA